MAKHAKKKQKTSKTAYQNAPDSTARLNLLLDDSTKDDEERRLESALFGVKYNSGGSGKGKEKAIIDLDDEGEEMIAGTDGGRALAHLEDTDVSLKRTTRPGQRIDLDIAFLRRRRRGGHCAHRCRRRRRVRRR